MIKAVNPNVDGVHMHLENRKLSRHFFWFLWIMYAIVYMTKNCFSAAMASIVAEGILTKSQTGLITTVFNLVYTPLQVVGGIFADKYNPERMVKIGLIGGAISNAIIFLNRNYYVMLAAWTFNAVAQFALWPAVFKIMSSQLVRSDRKMMVFYMTFATSAGLLLAYLTAAFITKWEYNFALSSLLLFALAVVMHFYYKRIEPSMKPDKEEETAVKADKPQPRKQMSTGALFTLSGFFIMLIVFLFRFAVEQGLKTLSPTMLMESYTGISPTFGNLMGTVIIIIGVIGVFLSRLLYPKYIRNELGGHCLMIALTLPFMAILRFIGIISVPVAVLSISAITLLLTSTHLFGSYYNMAFTKYGKNGTAAGVSNAASSLGIVIYSSGFSSVADNFGWQAVMNLALLLLLTCVPLNLIAFLMWRRFKKKYI